MWWLARKDGTRVSIPPDPFVFWARLCLHVLLSNKDSTDVLWCLADTSSLQLDSEKGLCFRASILDSDLWTASDALSSATSEPSRCPSGNSSESSTRCLSGSSTEPTRCLSGQWKVSLAKEGSDMRCRLSLLKSMTKDQFPSNPLPHWMSLID